MESEEKPKETEAEATEEAAPLNRAERRALAHKKSQGNAGSALRGGGNAQGSGRTAGQAGNIRLPRTGHK